MIPYIEQRLREWAEWSWLRIDGYYGIGGQQFDYDEHLTSSGIGLFKAGSPTDLRAMESEQGVAWLATERYRLGVIVVQVYRDHPNWSTMLHAEMLHVSRMSLWRHIDDAHALLLGYWLDRALGLCPQTEDLRLTRRQQARLRA